MEIRLHRDFLKRRLHLGRVNEEAFVDDAGHVSFTGTVVYKETRMAAPSLDACHDSGDVEGQRFDRFQRRAAQLAVALRPRLESVFV